MTPLQRQLQAARETHPGMLLLFRMGDFYECFDDDAREAAKVCGLTLTTRDRGLAMAGFPHHALEAHLRKLITAGGRVAVCEQTEPHTNSQRREVTRVVTPGELVEPETAEKTEPV